MNKDTVYASIDPAVLDEYRKWLDEKHHLALESIKSESENLAGVPK